MIESIIKNISNNALQAYFSRTISTFRPVVERFDYVIENEKFNDFSELVKLGEVDYENTDELLVFSCKYEGELSARSSKKKQFDIAKKVLKEDFKDGAIFVFYDETGKFRFSFIRKNYGEKEKKFTNWKRYTYFVDPDQTNRTFKQRINACSFQSLEEIFEAFSVEPLNKEFYSKIVSSFYSLVGGEIGKGKSKEKLQANLVLPGNNKDRTITRQFGVRLVGRIIFCWFLKHKFSRKGISLIPSEWLSLENVSDDYYHSTLEKLFFEILNREPKNRSKLLPDSHELIPFLNGGLFEPQTGIDKDYYESNKANYALKISDKWFKELFEILEQYNFTIDENSVNDAEVSIDPEMLGRIFENLLAEIDPNLKSTDKKSVRNATGSFYTPREIVDYMVEEALVKYLHNKTKLSETDLHILFGDDLKDEEELPFSELQKEEILTAFDGVKILDPAAGSGAFPMGALHKIVAALQKLDPGAEAWKAKQLDKISNAALYSEMKSILDKANAEYSRKLGVLQQCIYGADIQPIAAEISRLRSFLSLIVDEEINDDKPNRGILALPNLEFKFVTANTLIGLDNSGAIETPKVSELLPQLQKIRFDYLQAHGEEKEELRSTYRKLQKEIFSAQLELDPNMKSRPMQLASWDPFKNEVAEWFDAQWMFGVSQFDIVIGNPPYGGTKITNELKSKLSLGSKDPYGAFLARYLRKKTQPTPLKHNGILAFIVSDTFMTIKTHKPLRDFLLENQIHSMIRVHPDTFKATVNTAIIICERLEKEKEDQKLLLMADFTNTSIHEEHDRFEELLGKVTEYTLSDSEEEAQQSEEVLYMKGKNWSSESSPEYAIYCYLQSLIKTNTNHPFFVASPKLFGLMNDTTATKTQVEVGNRKVDGRSISINNKEISVIKLGDVAEVKQGLATGDNDSYLFQNPEARGTYRDINQYKDYLLTERDLDTIRNNENLRKAVINKGISKDDSNSERYFSGRYIIPHDKGGESDIDTGWLPNYFVHTNYYIDWSEWAVKRIKTYKGDSKKIKSRFQNTSYYFLQGIDYSQTGIYSPTFRINSASNFNTEATSIFSNLNQYDLLSNLTSKKNKFFIKNYVDTTVHASADKIKDSRLIEDYKKIRVSLIELIIKNQKETPKYDYASHEQLEIDYLVYKAYGLNWADVQEIEHWYARRYSKLVDAQKQNLADLGKPIDYIEIYKQLAQKYGDLS